MSPGRFAFLHLNSKLYISVFRSTKQSNGLQGYKSHVFKNSNIRIPTPKNYSKGCHLQIACTKMAPLNMPTCLEQSRLELPESGRTESQDPMLTNDSEARRLGIPQSTRGLTTWKIPKKKSRKSPTKKKQNRWEFIILTSPLM